MSCDEASEEPAKHKGPFKYLETGYLHWKMVCAEQCCACGKVVVVKNPEVGQLTDDERDLGFELRRMPNPQGNPLSGEVHFYPVVCRKISESTFIFKQHDLVDGNIAYKQRVYGKRVQSHEGLPAEWMPIGQKVYSDPGQAVHECELELEEPNRLHEVFPFLRIVPCPIPPETDTPGQ